MKKDQKIIVYIILLFILFAPIFYHAVTTSSKSSDSSDEISSSDNISSSFSQSHTREVKIPENVEQFSYINTCDFRPNNTSGNYFITASYIKDGTQEIREGNNAAAGTPYTWYKNIDKTLHRSSEAKNIYTKDYFAPTSTWYDTFREKDIRLKYFGNVGCADVKVEYINYWEDDKQPDPKWAEYFRRKIEEKTGPTDTPILISEAWIFEYNGMTCAAVNATNVPYTLENLSEYKNLTVSEGLPYGDNHAAYMCSAVFIGDNYVKDIFRHVISPISNDYPYNQSGDPSFIPPQEDHSVNFVECTSIQTKSDGTLSLYEFYVFYFEYYYVDRTFFIYDVDNDGYLELIYQNYQMNGSDYTHFFSVYKVTESGLIASHKLEV